MGREGDGRGLCLTKVNFLVTSPVCGGLCPSVNKRFTYLLISSSHECYYSVVAA